MTLWRTYYHLIWATHDRYPLILTDYKPILHKYLHQKIHNLDAQNYAIGGMPDHIHLIVSIPPKISIAELDNAIDYVKRQKQQHAESTLIHALESVDELRKPRE